MEELLSRIQDVGKVGSVEVGARRLLVRVSGMTPERLHGLIDGFLRRHPDVSALVILRTPRSHELSVKVARPGRVFGFFAVKKASEKLEIPVSRI